MWESVFVHMVQKKILLVATGGNSLFDLNKFAKQVRNVAQTCAHLPVLGPAALKQMITLKEPLTADREASPYVKPESYLNQTPPNP